MPRSVNVTIAGKQYVVSQIPSRASSEWRKKFSEPLTSLLNVLDGLGSLKIDKVEDFMPIVRTLATTALTSIDLIHDMVFDYSRELAEDRERLETEGYDDEFVETFMQILSLAYPFGSIVDQLRDGLKATGTSKSSHSPSGG